MNIIDKYIIRYNKINKISNKTPTEKGLLLELYYCITHKNTFLWNDIDNKIKLKYKYTYYDSGIDCATIDKNNNIISIIQCKNYNGLLNTVNLEGFNYNCIKTIKNNNTNIKLILCISTTTKLCKQLIEDKLYEIEILNLPDYITENNIKKENKKIILRDYQLDCINSMNNFINNKFINNKRYIVSIPCGCGKSIIIKEFCLQHLDKKILILVPSQLLVEQFLKEFNNINCNYLVTNHELYDDSLNITICCYNSIYNVMNIHFNYIIIDEAHHIQKPRIYTNNPLINQEINSLINPLINSEINQELTSSINPLINPEINSSINPLINPEINSSINPLINSEINSLINPLINSEINQKITSSNNPEINSSINPEINSSINPELTSSINQEITSSNNSEITSSINPLINQEINLPNYQSVQYIDIIKYNLNYDYEFYFSATIDNPNYIYSLDKAIENSYLVDYQIEIHNITNNKFNSCRLILQNPSYQKTIIYCNEIKTCNELNKYLNENNLKSMTLTSELNKQKRKEIINKFENNEINILCSVNCLSEGINIPCIDTCLFFDDRSSVINIIQCLGRCLRLYPTKIKAKMIILSSKENKDKYYNKYLQAITFSDKFFKENYKTKLLFRYDNDYFKDLDETKINNSITKIINYNYGQFEKLIIKRYTIEERLNICEDYYNTYKCLPYKKEIYKGVCIYNFINGLINKNEIDYINRLNKIFGYDFIKYGLNHENLFIMNNKTNYYNKIRKINQYYYNLPKWNYYKLNLEYLKKIIFEHHITNNDLQFILKLNDYNLLSEYKKFTTDDFNNYICLNKDYHLIDTINEDKFKFFIKIHLDNDITIFNGNNIIEKKQTFINYIINCLHDILLNIFNYNIDELKYILQIKNNHNETLDEISFNIIYYNLYINIYDYNEIITYIINNIKLDKWNINKDFIIYDKNKSYLYNNLHFIYQSIDNKTYFYNIYNKDEFIKDKSIIQSELINKLIEEYVFELTLLN